MRANGDLGRRPEQIETCRVLWWRGLDLVAVAGDVLAGLADPGVRLALRHDSPDDSNTVALEVALEVCDLGCIVDVAVVDDGDEICAEGVYVGDFGLQCDEQAVPGCLYGDFFAGDETALDVGETCGERDWLGAVE